MTAPEQLILSSTPPPGRMRLIVIAVAFIGALLACAFGVSYLAASRSASRAALQIAPDLGRLDSDFGLHHQDSGGSALDWQFDYGPSELGPLTLQLYVGWFGQLHRSIPPEALDSIRPPH